MPGRYPGASVMPARRRAGDGGPGGSSRQCDHATPLRRAEASPRRVTPRMRGPAIVGIIAHRPRRGTDPRSLPHDAIGLRGRRRTDWSCLCSAAPRRRRHVDLPRLSVRQGQRRAQDELDQAWLDRVRNATVRLSNCTGSFVSAEGLILTNHHCVESCLAELSSKEKSLVEDGFLAKTRDEEKRCQTQVADMLDRAWRTSPRRLTAATAGKDETAANDVRKATLTQLEQRLRERRATAPQVRDGRRCTRAASTGSTSTSATPTCASCSRRKRASRRSAATPTTSSFRAGASTWDCCAPTRDGKPAKTPDYLRSTSRARRRASRCSSRAIPARPTGC